MKFRKHMYLDKLQKLIRFQGHWSKVKVTSFLGFFNVHNVAATTCGLYLALSKAW